MRYALDANIWRYATTHPAFASRLRSLALTPIGLPAVVVSELLRRAVTDRAAAVAEKLVDTWRHALLAPNPDDWIAAARTLRQLGRRQGYDVTGLARLQNDALIAVSCARAGWTLVTCNRDDFEKLTEILGRRSPRVIYMDAPA